VLAVGEAAQQRILVLAPLSASYSLTCHLGVMP
jgi:hypothetical protein